MARNLFCAASFLALLAGLATPPLLFLETAESAPTQTADVGRPKQASAAPPLQKVILAPDGTGTFVYNGGPGFTLAFHARDFTDAIRTVTGATALSRMPHADETAPSETTYPLPPLISCPHPIFSLLQGTRVAPLHTQALGDVLDELRGQDVQGITAPDANGKTASFKGTIVGVDAAGDPTKGVTYTLNLSTDSGIAAIPLAGATVNLTSDADPVKTELQDALNELARGTALWDRTITVSADDAANVQIRYSHPVPLWKIQYRLDLSDHAPKLSTSVTIRNTTAMDWKKANGDAVDLVLSGPAGDDSGRPFKVKLSKNQYATLQLADILIEAGKPDKLWGYQLGQASPFASATVGLTLPKVRPLPGPVVVVEDGAQVGSPTADLSVGADGAAKVLFPYTPLAVSKVGDTVIEHRPKTLVNGTLLMDATRKVTLNVSNSAKVDRTLRLTAEASYSMTEVDPQDMADAVCKDAVVIHKNTTTAITVVETGEDQHTLVGLNSSQLGSLISQPKPPQGQTPPSDLMEKLNKILCRRQEAEKLMRSPATAGSGLRQRNHRHRPAAAVRPRLPARSDCRTNASGRRASGRLATMHRRPHGEGGGGTTSGR